MLEEADQDGWGVQKKEKSLILDSKGGELAEEFERLPKLLQFYVKLKDVRVTFTG